MPGCFAASMICSAGVAGLSSGLALAASFAGGEAIAAEPNVVTLETFIRHFLRALSQRQHYQGRT